MVAGFEQIIFYFMGKDEDLCFLWHRIRFFPPFFCAKLMKTGTFV